MYIILKAKVWLRYYPLYKLLFKGLNVVKNYILDYLIKGFIILNLALYILPILIVKKQVKDFVSITINF